MVPDERKSVQLQQAALFLPQGKAELPDKNGDCPYLAYAPSSPTERIPVPLPVQLLHYHDECAVFGNCKATLQSAEQHIPDLLAAA